MNDLLTLLNGDCLEQMRTLPEKSVQCCVTSPPYWGLRDYKVKGQIGVEKTFAEWLERTVDVFDEVWRVLRDDGTLWINMGDCYNTSGGKNAGSLGQYAGRAAAKLRA